MGFIPVRWLDDGLSKIQAAKRHRNFHISGFCSDLNFMCKTLSVLSLELVNHASHLPGCQTCDGERNLLMVQRDLRSSFFNTVVLRKRAHGGTHYLVFRQVGVPYDICMTSLHFTMDVYIITTYNRILHTNTPAQYCWQP